MEFNELIQKRYSVREYRPDPIDEKILEKVLNAACLAPTAANLQPFQLLVVHTKGKEKELQRIYQREWYTQAPLVIVVCTLPYQAWVREDGKCYADIDAAIVMDHLILAATESGLGTCWIGTINVQEAREIFGLPEYVEPVLMTPLGYPVHTIREKERKPLKDLVRYDRW